MLEEFFSHSRNRHLRLECAQLVRAVVGAQHIALHSWHKAPSQFGLRVLPRTCNIDRNLVPLSYLLYGPS